MTFLAYRDGAQPHELPVGTCVVRRARESDRQSFWILWFLIQRQTDQTEELVAVRVNPGGPPIEGTGEEWPAWGLVRSGVGRWDISPSINVLESAPGSCVIPGACPKRRSLWHETPTLIEVPEPPPWERDAPSGE